MDRVTGVLATLALRQSTKLRVRLPLAKLCVAASDADQLVGFVDLIKDEVSVKVVELTTDLATHGTFEIMVNARAAGPRLGLDRRHDHRRSRTAALARADVLGPSKHLETVEHEDRRLIPAHVLDRTRDLAILDQKVLSRVRPVNRIVR